MQHQPFFNGEQFSLIDAAFAPCFTRLSHLEKLYPLGLLNKTPKIQMWAENLLARKSVQQSIASDFAENLKENIIKRQSYLGIQISITSPN